MSSSSVNVSYRPIRFALLVRKGVLKDFRDAAQLSTLTWGGIGNLVYGVGADRDAAVTELRLLGIDAVFPIGGSAAVRDVAEALPELSSIRGVSEFFGDENSGVIDAVDVCADVYQKHFRFGNIETSRVVLPTWGKNHRHRELFAAVFGDHGDSRLGARTRRAYLKLARESVDISRGVPSPGVARSIFPIHVTSDQLSAQWHSWVDDGIFVGNGRSADDLRDFWNLRASGATVTFWPTDAADLVAPVTTDLLSRMRAVDRSVPLTVWLPKSLKEVPAALSELLASRGVQYSISRNRPRLRENDAIWSTSSTSVLASVDESRPTRPELAFTLPSRPFSSLDGDGDSWRKNWVIDLSTFTDAAHAEHTLQIPSISRLDGWASSQMNSINDVRLRGGEVGVVERASETHLRLSPVSREALVHRTLQLAGYSAELSSAGEATSRMIRQLGGIHGCRVFRIPGVRELFRSDEKTFTWHSAMNTIHDGGTFNRYGNVKTAAVEFRGLLEKGVFRAQLRIKCGSCSVNADYLPEQLVDNMNCERCGSELQLATVAENSDWIYRPSGFFARNHEHGALPVLLSVLRLTNGFGATHFSSSTLLTKGDRRCESDFVLFEQNRAGDTAMVVAECKGGKQTIDQRDVDNLSRVAKDCRSAGIECYTLFATTRKSFTAQEIRIFKGAAERRDSSGLILFTGDELENFSAYGRSASEKLPERYANNCAAFAMNSYYRYLRTKSPMNLPSREADEYLV